MLYDSLALCGGGAKGAYQIGVMKAMKEAGTLGRINTISGTSVGALNALLFAIGYVQLAEDVWLNNVDQNMILNNIDVQRGEISRDGLKAMLKYIGVSRLSSSPKVYVYVHNVRLDRPEAFLLNGKSESDIITLLLASSALPVAYSPVEYHGELYKDGGCTAMGNCPLNVLYDNGRRNIILVPLNNRFNPYSVGNAVSGENFSIYEKFPGADIKIIKPSLDIGQLVDGTLDFRTDSIKQRVALGYHDAKEILDVKKGVNENMDINCNDKIRRLAGEVLKTPQDFETFVSISKFKHANLKLTVMRMEICYDKIFELGGWTIEWHKVPFMGKHYRIIDPDNRRRAYTFDPEEIIKNLILFRERNKQS